jgi:Tfp pilus assembly PilM family ATPase
MTRALGIDIGFHSIKIAELSFMGKEASVLGLFEIDISPEDSVEAKLLEFFQSQVVKPERVAVGLGPIPILFRRTMLPFGDRKKAELAIRNEFEDSLPFALDNYVLEFHSLGKTGRSHIFQAALCQQQHIDKLNTYFQSGLSLPANHFLLDNEALGRLALWQHPAATEQVPETFCVCDIGFRSTKIALIKQVPQASVGKKWKELGQNVLEYRSLNKGLQELFDWMQIHKKISHEDLEQWLKHRARILSPGETAPDSLSNETSDEIKTALKPLLVEIYQTLQSFKSKQNIHPERILLTGSLTLLPGFKEFLASELRLEVENWEIFRNLKIAPTMATSEKNAQFALAIALAHRYNPAISVPTLNFKRSSLANKKIVTGFMQQVFSPAHRPFWIGAAASFAFLFVYNALNMFFASQEKTTLKKQLIEELRLAEPMLAKRALGFYHDPDRTREIFDQEKNKVLRQYSQNQEARLNILLALSQDLPAGVTVEDLEIREGGRSTTLRVQMQVPTVEGGKVQDKASFEAELNRRMSEKGFKTLKLSNLRPSVFLWEASREGAAL